MTTRAIIQGLCCIAIGASWGCSRAYYRESADRESYPIMEERVASPQSAIGRTKVEPAPTSRLADPLSADCPPKPPDDIVAAGFMENPGGNPGYRHWDKYGYTDTIEPVGWEQSLGLNDQGVLKLTREKAVEIALNNSREYQTNLENVYIAALALTLNRFDFELQWFGTNNTGFAAVGSNPGTKTLTTTDTFGFTRNLAAGGQLLTNFANSFVWEFTGHSYSASSSIGATLIQPLLRGFGRDIRLETLTQGERDVLYSVRSFAQYRKQFWSSITVDSGGYLQLLNAVQAVRNAQANVKIQEQNYALYQKLFQGGRTQAANVDQILQGVLAARSNVISADIALQTSLDAFKLRLGLPPRLKVELDDSPLEEFRLVDPADEAYREEIEAFKKARYAELDAVPNRESLRDSFARLESLIDRAEGVINHADADLKKWKSDLEKPNDDREGAERARQAYEGKRDKPAELRQALNLLKKEVASHKLALTEKTRKTSWDNIIASASAVAGIVDSAIAAESLARIYLIRLPDVKYGQDEAMAYAKEHRLDLQNAQAQVTDAWRKVNVAANALQSDLTVQAQGTLGSTPGSHNPFEYSASGSQMSVGVQFNTPLNRQAERNAFRVSQITYQRARRNYMALSDNVEFSVRSSLRQLNQARLNFEISRQQLLVAVRQLETERRILENPVQKNQQGGNTDDPTLRILNAQQQLLNARNSLASNLFEFERQRVQLLLNVEALTLDDRGFPTDEAPRLSPPTSPAAAPSPTPPAP
ncbi:MAG: TolC family protein [Gemmataceae bacterium]